MARILTIEHAEKRVPFQLIKRIEVEARPVYHGQLAGYTPVSGLL